MVNRQIQNLARTENAALRRLPHVVVLGLILVGVSGCPVPQPPGLGKQSIRTEPRTKAQYYLYLPEAYVKNNGQHPAGPNRQWPLVMTFHGMKPYDTWDRQAHEWEQEADNYGYIVCAPWLQSCDSFMEYPLRREHNYVLADRERVLAIMEDVFKTTRADPKAVLSTSWSCGGYLAHYFVNRFPDKFTCIATRLSNFSPDLLLEQNVPRYRDTPVAIFIGDGDFPACKSESEQAVAWYRARSFRKVVGKTIDNMGHRRIPQCAAAFFAEHLGIEPLKPNEAATTLAQVRMRDYNPPQTMLAQMSPREQRPAPTTPAPVMVASSAAPASMSRPTATPVSAAGAVRVADGARAGATATAPPRPPQPILPAASPSPQKPAPGTAQKTQPPQYADAKPRPRATTPQQPTQYAQVTPSAPPRTPDVPSRPATTISNPPSADRSQFASAAPAPRPIDSARPASALPARPAAAASGPPAQRTAIQPPRREPEARAVSDEPAAPNYARGARNAPIRLTGPAVGTAPLHIAFAVELPPSVLRGADFLWMDNGMWICDEQRGVKILDTPGRHRISVLVVTRDGEEYRGHREVVVLGKE